MLKITESKPDHRTVVLRLEGQIVGPWVEELNQVCEPFMNNGRQLTLELAEVRYVDEAGIAALIDLMARGARLLNATPFVDKQLHARRTI